jgi:hypothetical protein
MAGCLTTGATRDNAAPDDVSGAAFRLLRTGPARTGRCAVGGLSLTAERETPATACSVAGVSSFVAVKPGAARRRSPGHAG